MENLGGPAEFRKRLEKLGDLSTLEALLNHVLSFCHEIKFIKEKEYDRKLDAVIERKFASFKYGTKWKYVSVDAPMIEVVKAGLESVTQQKIWDDIEDESKKE